MAQCKKRIGEINGSLREEKISADDRQVENVSNAYCKVDTTFCAIRNKLKEEAEHTRTEMISKG